jgi:hypothetical protein
MNFSSPNNIRLAKHISAMGSQHVLDRRDVYVGIYVLLERRRKPTSLRLEDNIKMDLKLLEWTVRIRFGSGQVPGWGCYGKLLD